MSIRRLVILGALLVALVPAAARAQEQPVIVNFGGGPTFIGGELGKRFNMGWGPAVGVAFKLPNEAIRFQFEYAYRWFDLNTGYGTPFGIISANHQTHQLDFNLEATLTHPDSSVRVYIVAGPGASYRKVDLTNYQGTGVICDPYWYVCGTYPIGSVIGSRGGWDFGFNVGGGIGFKINDASEFYIESRYHYVVGPDIEPPAGSTLQGSKTTGHYMPLTFGFRF